MAPAGYPAFLQYLQSGRVRKLPMWRRTRDTGVKANTEEEETVNRTLRVAGVWEAAREHSPAE